MCSEWGLIAGCTSLRRKSFPHDFCPVISHVPLYARDCGRILATEYFSGRHCLCSEQANGEAVRVLVIDDDKTLCQLLAEVLEGKGLTVAWTTDGLKGYETSLYETYDLFILDQCMPLILGTELVKELKKDNPRAKIILTSAFADETLKTRTRSLGVPLLSKPFSTNQLIQMVENVLGWSKQRDN